MSTLKGPVKLKSILILVWLLCVRKMTHSHKNYWTMEFQDVKTSTSNAEYYDIHLEVVRVSRGVFATSGFVDFKVDLDDNVIVEANLYRSNTGGKDFSKLPMEIANETLTEAMNNFYKPLLMEDMHKCCENAPYFEEFAPPLTKRRLILKDCIISADNMPSHMQVGLYQWHMVWHGLARVEVDMFMTIETDEFFG